MIGLILNSGLGHRMGDLTSKHPKCMTEITDNESILSRQLNMITDIGINKVIITTGYYDDILVRYCQSLNLELDINFVKNPIYDKTNYIYSIFCAKEYLHDDVMLMHGDLVFDYSVLKRMISTDQSCMAVDTKLPLSEKDFKAVINNGKIVKVGVEFFKNSIAAQPLYKLNKIDWDIWLDKIVEYCKRGEVNCYAEKALNEIANQCNIIPCDVRESLCREVDTPEDLKEVIKCLNK